MRIEEQANLLNHDKAPEEPDIRVNLGINTGLVFLGATVIKGVVGERLTYTASGMVTNIAARLCAFGREGAIHLGEATASEVAGHFALYGPIQARLKHVPEVTPVYRVESAATPYRQKVSTQTRSA